MLAKYTFSILITTFSGLDFLEIPKARDAAERRNKALVLERLPLNFFYKAE